MRVILIMWCFIPTMESTIRRSGTGRGKLVILINNGIHPGEPDGVDASMLLIRDLVAQKIHIPDNIALAVIPLYNIGGALNRSQFFAREPKRSGSYGFRGNAQNLDLNRDFTKNDSRNARSFAQIFHWVNPDLQIDNHVSDGADYQYTMTLLCSQWNKLGGQLGAFLHDVLQPASICGHGKTRVADDALCRFRSGESQGRVGPGSMTSRGIPAVMRPCFIRSPSCRRRIC